MSDFLRGLHHDPHPKHVAVTIDLEPAASRFQLAMSDFIERAFGERAFGPCKLTQDDMALVAGPR